MATARPASSYSLPKGIPSFDVETSTIFEYEVWEDDWERYLRVTGLESASPQMKVDLMLSGFSTPTKGLIKKFDLSDQEREDEQLIRQKLKSFIRGSVSRLIERRKFRRRTQKPNEDIDVFVMELREIMKTCEFCDKCAETVMCDQVAEGLRNEEAIKEMLREDKLDLKTAISIARSHEESAKCRDLLMDSPKINIVEKTKPGQKVLKTKPEATCTSCGYNRHLLGKKCPAKDQECNKCRKTGHFGSVCRNEKTFKSTTVKISSMKANRACVNKISHAKPCHTIEPLVKSANGQAMIQALPDTGAEFSGAGLNFLSALGEDDHNLIESDLKAEVFNGQMITAIGCIPVTVQFNELERVEVMVFIFREVKNFILSWFASKELGLLSPNFPLPGKSLCSMTPSIGDQSQQAESVDIPISSKGSKVLTNKLAAVEPQIEPKLPIEPSVSSELQEHQVSALSLKTFGHILDKYSEVFDGKVKAMKGEKYAIHLKPGAVPFAVIHPRTVALPLLPGLKAELELYSENGLIAPQTKPTDWCQPIVVVPKRGTNDIRMCVDFTKLNMWVKRELYWSNTPLEAVADIPDGSLVFSVFDALKGYHQCELDEESQDLTTFITPFGRFKFLRAPYGINSISEHYNRRMSEAFEGLDFVRKIVDDITLFSKNESDHSRDLDAFLNRCRIHRISLSLPKVQLGKPEVKFAGFSLSSKGYSISSEITEALTKFPTPSGISDVRSFFGLANQVSAFNKDVCQALEPLRGLLQTRNAWHWDKAHDEAFNTAKLKLAETVRLSFYHVSKPTRLITDASRTGLGFLLQQEDQDGIWRTVQVGSRMLKEAEARYAVIELELLGIQFGVEKCRIFLLGLDHFFVITDHNPLVAICNSHRLDEIENPRLQRIRAKLLGYNFTVKWMAGKQNEAADALSRHPVSRPDGRDVADDEINFDGSITHACTPAMIRSATSIEPIDPLLQDLKVHADRCPTYQEIKKVVQSGFPNAKSLLSPTMKPFWKIRHELTIDEHGFILFGFRLLIPESIRPSILVRLHDAHQGITRTQARARQVLYWPNIDADIETFISTCKFCQDHLPRNRSEPLVQKERPSRPFEELAVDLATVHGRDFLILVDCATDWPDVIDLGHDTTSLKLIEAMRSVFCRTGAPLILWSDNGPQLVSVSFEEFLHDWGVIHKVSSPHFPQSNGKSEAAVKSMKKLLKACWKNKTVDLVKLTRALLSYRNTPCHRDDKSPAEKLFGTPIRDGLPAHRTSFHKNHQICSAQLDRVSHHDRYSKTEFDRHAKLLPPLVVGDLVAILDSRENKWSIYGTIVEVCENRRYFIKTPSGAIFCRNRKFLRKRHPMSVPPSLTPSMSPSSPSPQPINSPKQVIVRSPRPQRTRTKPDRLGF